MPAPTLVALCLRRAFPFIEPTPQERTAPLVGDTVVPAPDAVMDRGFTVPAPPETVWPWIVQLGKARGGWYLPRSVERFVPRRRRATRALLGRWQGLEVGDVIPDYGGRDETFTVESITPPYSLVYPSRRGRIDVSWQIELTHASDESTRVHLRLRLGPIRRRWLVDTFGELFDALTIAGMAAGLRERVAP